MIESLTHSIFCKKRVIIMAEHTKIWIADKMKELMKTKPLDKIRVTEICRVAEIERPTFYYHFTFSEQPLPKNSCDV